LFSRCLRRVGRVQYVQDTLVVQHQAFRYHAGLVQTEDAVQVVGGLHGTVGIMLASRRSRKTAVVVRNELRDIGVRAGDVADLAQPQLLHQPVLQCQVSTLHAALGRRSICADDVDIQASEGSAELCDASPSFGLLPVDSEHAGLVAVQRHRLTVLPEV
jgi:hypothetical protein